MRKIDADRLEKEMLKKSVIIDEDEHEDEYAARGLNTYGMKQLFDEQPTFGAWIPVSERLPNRDGEYLVTTCWEPLNSKYIRIYDWANDLHKVCLEKYPKHKSGWYIDVGDYGCFEQDDVIAWQPLPPAWEGEHNV